MRMLFIAVIAVLLAFGGQQTFAQAAPVPSIESAVVEHGGGCRRSSPPGQCCHMDRKAGVVHCH